MELAKLVSEVMTSFTLRFYKSDKALYPDALVARATVTKKGRLSEGRDEMSVELVEGDQEAIAQLGLRKVTRQIQDASNKIVGVLIPHY